MSLNRVQLIGNLTRDPEIKQIPGGQVVASFGIATNFRWKDQSGEMQEKVEFHNIVAWRKLAEICGQYLRKGSKIYIEGRLQTRDWEAEDGTKKYRTEIVAENMIMLDKKGDISGAPMDRNAGGISEPAAEKAPAAAPAASASGDAFNEMEDKKKVTAKKGADDDVSVDDLPF